MSTNAVPNLFLSLILMVTLSLAACSHPAAMSNSANEPMPSSVPTETTAANESVQLVATNFIHGRVVLKDKSSQGIAGVPVALKMRDKDGDWLVLATSFSKNGGQFDLPFSGSKGNYRIEAVSPRYTGYVDISAGSSLAKDVTLYVTKLVHEKE